VLFFFFYFQTTDDPVLTVIFQGVLLSLDATFFEKETILATLILEWHLGADPTTTFFANVSLSGLITSPVVNPEQFVFRFDVDDTASGLENTGWFM
jgi:hypothetical protein